MHPLFLKPFISNSIKTPHKINSGISVSKTVLFLMGISAIVTSLAAIAFIIIGLLLSGNSDSVSGNYIFISGAGMVLISICFTIGLFQLKNVKPGGKIWATLASAGLVIILGFSAFLTLTTSPGWKFTTLIVLLSLVIILPFIWLIFYLWTFDKK